VVVRKECKGRGQVWWEEKGSGDGGEGTKTYNESGTVVRSEAAMTI
jgi:hypothetical protein